MFDKVFGCEGAYRVEEMVALSVEHVKATNISNASSAYALNSQYTYVSHRPTREVLSISVDNALSESYFS